MSPADDTGRRLAACRRSWPAGTTCTPMAGDASTRRFFRVSFPAEERRILMMYPPDDVRGVELFREQRALLAGIGWPVPTVGPDGPAPGTLWVEDLGDGLLYEHVIGIDSPDREALYAAAVDLLGPLQRDGTARLRPGDAAFDLRLDRELFERELEMTRRYYLAGWLGARRSSALDAGLRELARLAAASPVVLCHRDYHSRNLLVRNGALAVVDFQDARLGPRTYDLASLVFDSYVRPGRPLRDRLIERFRTQVWPDVPAETFERELRVVALQRNLKALGTFAYQKLELGRDRYLESIPPTVDAVHEHLGALSGHGALTEGLRGVLPARGSGG